MLKLLAIGAALYLGMLGILFVLQRTLIYYPSGARPEPPDGGVPEMAPVSVTTADGLALLAWWRAPRDERAPVMLYLHGNAGTLAHRGPKLRPFLDRGWGVLIVAWRGYSGNPGRPTEDGLYADGRAATAFIDGQRIAPGRIVLYGESLGSGVAVQLASERAPGALVLEAPFSSLADAAASHYPFFPVRWLVRDRYDSAAKIGSVAAPSLIVHGERDDVVPVALGRRLLARAGSAGEGLFLAEAGHNDLYDFDVPAHVVRFVETRMGLDTPNPP